MPQWASAVRGTERCTAPSISSVRSRATVSFSSSGSLELADATIRLLDRYDVVMWEKHGALAVGGDVIECFDMIDTLSKSAQIYLQARAMGFEPEGLTDEQSEELRKAFRLV